LSDISVTQADADALLAMEKHRIDDAEYDYPGLGGALRIPLQSPDKREAFMLDVSRSQIKLTKGTYQNRGRGVVILARLDFGGAPHRNPAIRRFPALTCTFIVRVSEIVGPFRYQAGVSPMLTIDGRSL